MSEGNDLEYRKIITDFIIWCKLNQPPSIAPVNIHSLDIDVVDTYKFLGVHLNKFHLLGKLRYFGLCRTLLRTVYDTLKASATFYFVICPGGGSTERDRKQTDRLVKSATSVLTTPIDLIEEVGERRSQALPIVHTQPTHETVEAQSTSFISRLLRTQKNIKR